jgi:cytochrome c peroxidase
VQVPDLIGLRDRKYLDRTGLVRHRSSADLMRYAALNNMVDLLNQYGQFIPGGGDFKKLPNPDAPTIGGRYSDEQLYALARYIYSLAPPENPNRSKAKAQEDLVAQGEKVFLREGCASCHAPESGYTNNKLTPALGFKVPDKHPDKASILVRSVGTEPSLATQTRRGTGFYKVPSLKGVWYRGPFEHNGSVATLEDWFDPNRLREDYVPTGWKGPPGTKGRAVKGHEFGLDLSEQERGALIAFLNSL